VSDRCPSCGATNPGGGVCAHHIPGYDDWAVRNRASCDLVHRRIQPPAALYATSDFAFAEGDCA
jgi:hypothetical protein